MESGFPFGPQKTEFEELLGVLAPPEMSSEALVAPLALETP